ncbi:MAG: hypothetical protein ACT4OI_05210 [Methanobacteriota archaeon]
MGAREDYERLWDMFAKMHRDTHGAEHAPAKGDFNCCGEWGVLMALRAASTVRPDYPAYLLARIAAMPDLDKEFYVKSVLATDGEPAPPDPEPLREYRASRRYHILWEELKAAATKIEGLERQIEALKASPTQHIADDA